MKPSDRPSSVARKKLRIMVIHIGLLGCVLCTNHDGGDVGKLIESSYTNKTAETTYKLFK
jgi:hypothetical protein